MSKNGTRERNREPGRLPQGAREYRVDAAPGGRRPFLGGVEYAPEAVNRLDQLVIHFYNEKTGRCYPKTLLEVLLDAARHYGDPFEDVLGFVLKQDPTFPPAPPCGPSSESSPDGGPCPTH